MRATDVHVPYITLSHKKIAKPWINKELEILIKNRHKLYKKFTSRPLTYGIEYRNYRNMVNRKIDTSKKDYFKTKFKAAFGNTKQKIEIK